ncbi:MAG: hypothetical protein KGL39_08745 [Patescibacteria group bacterium]|nr:hypothetical protein [Patescibacteria group bacterium]
MSRINTNKKGDIAEYKAILWLLEQGYAVFKNVECTGDTDLVAIKDGEFLRIDVKTVPTKNGELLFRVPKSEEQRAKGIKLLWVFENTVGWNRDYF